MLPTIFLIAVLLLIVRWLLVYVKMQQRGLEDHKERCFDSLRRPRGQSPPRSRINLREGMQDRLP